uniref:3HCDH_N domain-containing protein n=1 Tax=Heterorhabditis bacteriophora TaxID=37862 RepID=A0A1I7X6W9_HETBA
MNLFQGLNMNPIGFLRTAATIATRKMSRSLLRGIRVVELAGLAPVPHCGMVLADFGASVILIDKQEDGMVEQRLHRGKSMEKVDLKTPDGLERVKGLCRESDVLLDPYRPGVLEKMGLDPIKLMEVHLTLFHTILLCIILFLLIYKIHKKILIFLRTYETKDGKWMSVGALEPKFNAKLFEDVYSDPAGVAQELETIFKSKTREEWVRIFEGQNACVTPVLDIEEAGLFNHNAQRGSFVKEDNKWIPQPAPKFYSKEDFEKLMKSKL